ncbi:861_t:CDS:2 [Paraglomus brasilianum]|uniref:861_t:CDS:1 n=1 Tax=Paraglomus brasilianum TaxID=144538 RepID=A0A9N9F661_9GLOM|nr:861_t:CDS:2 [Paraglomus brasilianum]
MAIVFYRAKRNPMMFYFTLGVILLNALALLGLPYDFNWHKAPLALCYFQAIGAQFGALVTGICAFNFIIQTYRLLVLRKQSEIADSRLISYYYGSMIVYPIIGTILVTFVAIKTNAVGVRDLKCDIVSPIWVRLFGYNGINLFISIPGTYFSTRATWAVIRHLDQFKTNTSSIQSHTPMIESRNAGGVIHDDGETPVVQERPNFVAPVINSPTNKAYNITRSAAIRMVFFTTAYLLTNIVASIETILFALAGKSLDPHPGGSDITLVSLGIALFLIFGTAGDVRKWTLQKLKNLLQMLENLFQKLKNLFQKLKNLFRRTDPEGRGVHAM